MYTINFRRNTFVSFRKRLTRVLVTIICFVSIIILSSCSKEDINNYSFISEYPTKTESSEFLSVGETHNAIMYDLGLALEDTLDNYAQLGCLTEVQKDSIIRLITLNMPTIISNYSDLQMSDSSLMATINHFINSMAMNSYDTTSIGISIINTISDALTKINYNASFDSIDLELKDVYDTMLLTNNNKEALFIAVMRSSLSFWANAQNDITNPWHNYVNTYTLSNNEMTQTKNVRDFVNKITHLFCKKPIPKIVTIAIADAAGALAGAQYSGCTYGTSVIVGAVCYSAIAIIVS